MSESLVIIPTYNEKENIEAIIHAVKALKEDIHILIVDDGSPDGTAAIVKKLATEYESGIFLEERKGKQGLGTAYVHGFRWAIEHGYAYVFEMDADFSHPPKDLPNLLKACREDGADLAIGSRYINGVNVINWPMSRVLLSYFASMYVRFVTRMKIRDTTAGFKCYKTQVLQSILQDKIKFIGYAFQIEMKFRTWKYGFKIVEIPIVFTDRTKGESKMSTGIIKEAILGVLWLKIMSWFRRWDVKQITDSSESAKAVEAN